LHAYELDDGRGYDIDYDPGLCLRLVQVLVQQGFTDEQIRRMVYDNANIGFCWLRRQDDPGEHLDRMLATVARDKRPMLTARIRHGRELAALADGAEHSRKQIRGFVGTARDSDVDADLQALEEAGAITVRREQHGKTVWQFIKLAVSPAHFREIARDSRRGIAQIIRSRMGRARWAENHIEKKKRTYKLEQDEKLLQGAEGPPSGCFETVPSDDNSLPYIPDNLDREILTRNPRRFPALLALHREAEREADAANRLPAQTAMTIDDIVSDIYFEGPANVLEPVALTDLSADVHDGSRLLDLAEMLAMVA
jgi:hypothetical protein